MPTDFSERANNALTYAIELAKREKAKIILLHVYHLEPSISYIDVPVPDDEIKLNEEKWLDKLKSLQTKIEHAGGMRSERVARLDLAVDGIIKEAEERKVDLIIMGTHGASGLKELLMGSNTSRVIDRARCPVITVPEGALFHPVKKITYASNYTDIDVETIQRLLEIAEPFNAQINILHVYEEDEARARDEMQRFIEEADKKILYPNLSYQLLGGEDVEKKLEEYLQSEATDLLVLSTHARDLRDKLFGKSIAKKLVFHTKVPLMVFHHKKKEPIMIV